MAASTALGTSAGETEFTICCIPFFVYDIALGDTVGTDDSSTVRKVVKRSGRHVARVWFGDNDEVDLPLLSGSPRWEHYSSGHLVHLLGVDFC